MVAVPKPKFKKQQKAKNNPVPTGYERCAVCGRMTSCETHEVYGGINRQTSIRMKYQVKLCAECHRKVTNNHSEVAWFQSMWRKHFQLKQLKQWMLDGMTPDQADKQWLSLIGRNYL